MDSADSYFKQGRLRVDPATFAIVKARKPIEDAWALVQDHREMTVIVDEQKLGSVDAIQTDKGWRLITFEVTMPFEVVGFLARVSGALAEEKIPIFAVSSYSTDHILVKEENLEKAVKKLGRLGFKI
ncbi:ACT domain protein [uncultured archaeon]|nr:ACT domain protein [uncultured archaeon]